jgi:hypothetical protein
VRTRLRFGSDWLAGCIALAGCCIALAGSGVALAGSSSGMEQV